MIEKKSPGRRHRNIPNRMNDAGRKQRILIHKTFGGLATRGKCSMGWFFKFKLHLIINDKEEILNFMFAPGNEDDREPLKQEHFLNNIKGKLCADKGHIRKVLLRIYF